MRTLFRLSILGAIFSGVLIVAFMHERTDNQRAMVIDGEKHIVVIIPSYNNKRWYQENLRTLFAQKYNNYRVMYIDDCSSDGTGDLVEQYIKKSGQEHRVTLIKNKERHGALYNLYHAIHSCPDRAIIITYDGDDWLNGTDALETINRAYDDHNVWLTYGQFEEFPGKSLGICHPMPEHVIKTKSYRKEPWFTSHTRTFYAGLFKRIKEKDLKFEGDFFTVTWDQAFMFPMLEMADGHIKFIDKITYIYNQANPLNDFRLHVRKQLYCERLIRRKEQYDPLSLQDASSFIAI